MKRKTEYLSLSKELTEKIVHDLHYKSSGEIRRNPSHDIASVWRPAYVRDVEKILHSPYYNRYCDKTQVFSLYKNDDLTRRSLHVQLVSRIARNIGRILELDLDLIEAISLGHDIGHTPFGHAGEKALSSMMEKPFRHNEQSLRVVDKLERGGTGLNLTYEVRMGILGHTGDFIPETLEGQIVRTSDRIAYINHDIDDAMRAGILTEADIPAQIAEILGHSHSQRINTLVENMIENTMLTGTLGMQPDVAQAMDQLRTFMFARVYTNPVAKGEESKAKDMLCRLFEYYMKSSRRIFCRSWTLTAWSASSATTLPA